jgi:hypothetical protein
MKAGTTVKPQMADPLGGNEQQPQRFAAMHPRHDATYDARPASAAVALSRARCGAC